MFILRHFALALASVSLGEKSVGVLCSDELHRLRRQTFDVSDVLAGQNDVTGLVPHLATGRETGSEREKINTAAGISGSLLYELTCGSRPRAGESVSRQMCSSGICRISLSLCILALEEIICYNKLVKATTSLPLFYCSECK